MKKLGIEEDRGKREDERSQTSNFKSYNAFCLTEYYVTYVTYMLHMYNIRNAQTLPHSHKYTFPQTHPHNTPLQGITPY